MGGFGVFSVLSKEPGLFAAAFSICGGGDPETALSLLGTPLWVFHGSDDNIVPVRQSRNMVQAIRKAGGRLVRYTEYPGVGHASWTPAWKEPALEAWLLAHRKGIQTGPPDSADKARIDTTGNGGVRLSWSPPAERESPENRVWYYRLFRNDSLLAEPGPLETLFADSTASRGGSHAYAISIVNYYFQESEKAVFQK
jgi:dienelactone hydrolase